MVDPRMKGAEAARIAGSPERSARQQAHKWLTNSDISAAIATERKKFWEAKAMSREEMVAEISNIARFDMGRILHVTKDGDPFIDLSKADADDMRALGAVEVEDFTLGRGDDARDVRRVKAKPFDKLKALDLLAKVQGHLKDPSVKVDVTIDFASAMAEAESRVAKARE
jgi:phage terminase small subunit